MSPGGGRGGRRFSHGGHRGLDVGGHVELELRSESKITASPGENWESWFLVLTRAQHGRVPFNRPSFLIQSSVPYLRGVISCCSFRLGSKGNGWFARLFLLSCTTSARKCNSRWLRCNNRSATSLQRRTRDARTRREGRPKCSQVSYARNVPTVYLQRQMQDVAIEGGQI